MFSIRSEDLKTFSIIVSKPINIHWIKTGSQLYGKIMYGIVLQTTLHE